MPKFVVSLLKAWYGDAATPENDYGFEWLPRMTGDHSQLNTFANMAKGKVKGLFLMGQNPAAGAPNARLNREGLSKLDWLVVRDFFLLESADVLERGAGQPEPDRDRHRGILPARCSRSREAGHAHQHAEDAAMARQGG